MRSLSPEEAQKIVESAFAPFDCAVQFGPYKESLGFQVKDEDGDDLLTTEGLRKADYRDLDELMLAIELARENLERRGLVLDTWIRPD